MRRSLWLIIFTGIIIFFSGYSRSNYVFSLEPQQDLIFTHGDIERAYLDNGMRILLKEKHNLPLVSIFLSVLTGSAGEGDLNGSGVCHFIEHMLFKGSSNYGPGEVFKEIEARGGVINALTSYDYTGYKITVPSEFLPFALELLTEMIMNPSFNQEELDREKEVVLKEIKLNYDSPQRYGSRLIWENAFSVHPYKYPILGEERLFKNLSREDLLSFYHDKYVPNNMVLAIVGDIESEKTLSLIKELFKNFKAGTNFGLKNRPEPRQKQARKYEEEFTSGLTYLSFGYHGVALTDRDCFALDVLGTILGEGRSSRLYELICNKKKLAYSVVAFNYTPREPGLFIVSVLLEEKNRKRATSLIFEQIELLKKKKVSQEELESAKNRIISDIIFANQTFQAQARDLALQEGITGDFRFNEKYIQKIRQVNAGDIIEVAKTYLQRDASSIVALIPRTDSTTTKIPTSSRKSFELGVEYLKPQRQGPGSAAGQEVQSYVLDNGLRLLLRENKDLPIVSITATFKGGLRAEDESSNGLCNLVAKMLDKGTKTRNRAEIAYFIESKGVQFSAFSGNNSFVISLNLLSKDLDQMLELLADLIINSTFPKSELAKQKKTNLALLKSREDNIFESGKELLKRTLFQKHPFQFSLVGNKKSLKKIKRRDLIKFYRDFCVGKNMVLSVFGDLTTEEVFRQVKQRFAELPAGEAPLISPPREPKIKGIRQSSKTMQKQQSLLVIGFPGTTVYTQDRYPLEIICQLLSQPSGRLFTRIREKAGIAYTLGAYQVLGLDPGYLVIYVATTVQNLQAAKEEVLEQLRLLKQEGISEKNLSQLKRAVLSKRLRGRQTNSACALESALDELYGLGFNHYLKYPEQIERITVKDITKYANLYFDLNNYVLVTVGPEN